MVERFRFRAKVSRSLLAIGVLAAFVLLLAGGITLGTSHAADSRLDLQRTLRTTALPTSPIVASTTRCSILVRGLPSLSRMRTKFSDAR